MIKLYYRGGCGSSQRALSWFKKYNIDVKQQQINKITADDLLKLLHLSDEGFNEVVKRSGKNGTKIKRALDYIEHLSFNEAVNFLLLHPNILQTPIIINDDNHLIGFNDDEIRKFLPPKYRRHRLQI